MAITGVHAILYTDDPGADRAFDRRSERHPRVLFAGEVEPRRQSSIERMGSHERGGEAVKRTNRRAGE